MSDRLEARLISLLWGYDNTDAAKTAKRLMEAGVVFRSKCGCSCPCHADEDKPEWQGDCAGCCEPGMNCDCGRALKP